MPRLSQKKWKSKMSCSLSIFWCEISWGFQKYQNYCCSSTPYGPSDNLKFHLITVIANAFNFGFLLIFCSLILFFTFKAMNICQTRSWDPLKIILVVIVGMPHPQISDRICVFQLHRHIKIVSNCLQPIWSCSRSWIWGVQILI